jgi:hypothetical protein
MTYTISIASKKAGKVTATSSDGNTLTTSPRGPQKNPGRRGTAGAHSRRRKGRSEHEGIIDKVLGR